MYKMYKLHDWISIEKLQWQGLSQNPNAIHLLEKNMDKIKLVLVINESLCSSDS